MDLSKIESGKLELDSVVFEPGTLMGEINALFSGAAHVKDLALAQQWQGPPGQRYQADAYRLRQMIGNLVGNAIKFTPRGEVRLQGEEIQRDGQQATLRFSVIDTGVGIAADKLDLLFRPFSQADSSTTREFGGTGLGLSIVHNLARAMGGEVGVESQLGQGSRFWFSVPVQLASLAQEQQPTNRQAPLSSAGIAPLRQLRGHLLVAEDNAINAKVIESLLRRLGLSMTLVQDGMQAVQAVTKRTAADAFDLVLMDLQMPELDGYAATQQIRQWETEHAQARLPIIALTADAFDEVHQRCLAVGMDGFLTKPVAISALQSSLSPWLQEQPAEAPLLKALDRDAFVAAVRELLPLLEQNKFAAVGQFKKLQQLAQGTAQAEALQALESALQELSFDPVRQGLQEILGMLEQLPKGEQV